MVNDPKSKNIKWHDGSLSRQERWQQLDVHGATLWLTGLSGSGKSTVAVALENELLQVKKAVYRLDGDNIRHGLNADLGFSAHDRKENIRRIGQVSQLFADSGMICLVSFISPYQADRELARSYHQQAGLRFIEVFVDTPLDICESRDPKGLYKKARSGEIQEFTGISAPYEAPSAPEIHLKTAEKSAQECARECLAYLRAQGVIQTGD